MRQTTLYAVQARQRQPKASGGWQTCGNNMLPNYPPTLAEGSVLSVGESKMTPKNLARMGSEFAPQGQPLPGLETSLTNTQEDEKQWV